ncbi:entry exclusion protein TrbK [Rhizobium lusitanum]|uniref:entry exclusion protein TrbK n=1 Tax=Rhizobium lusitanum TaxID=293958 RepID=UPI00195D37B9|nr:entry exclusion protein TrbK [Rhizobium lusitanum]MBM7046280.1 entry exclusion protein TrbK [Rhizobium lusitanum]
MVVSKLFLVVVLFSSAAGAGGAVWLLAQSNDPSQSAAGTDASESPLNDEARRRAEKFFGGQHNYDLTGGQEMKPRW